ncbi:LexA repressor [Gemmata sp. SH-PL17]|uniref:transcriptional repressor LexA n=1 Tax=Gemmata sp. SH-PL17 TaxID=1630693 RepID=UPI00078B1CC5|nr:transcriptional repressor LexA [Gemmata sp. SH-PL17]AMV30145.1 LexA repressor [Gemmata sp. SH-PL17]
MDELTDREAQAFDFIREYITHNGRAPSVRDVGRELGYDYPGNAQPVVDALVAKGRLVNKGGHRGLALAHGPKGFAVPIDGRVAAGVPQPPASEPEGWLEIEKLFTGVRMLRVQGESMIEAHIMPGDFVAVRPCSRADEGQVVLAQVDGQHTLKVYRVIRGKPWLYPRNKALEPIRLDAESDPRLCGVFVGLVRTAV